MTFYLNRSLFQKETKKEIDGNDFLVAYDVPIAKTGIQQYTREEVGEIKGNPYEFVNVYRDKSTFEDEKVLQSFDGIPIVYDHPENGKLDSDNYKHYIVGTVSGVYYKDGNLYAKKLTIIDKDAIEKVLDKETNQLSIGFRGKITKQSGIYEGQKYQYIEDVIHANHLALCEKGKAGPLYAINSFKKKGKNIMNEEKMKDCYNEGDELHVNLEALIQKTVKEQLAKIKPKMIGDEDEVAHHLKKEELAEQHLEKEHAMGDESLEESEHKDKDVINALKSTNRKLQDMVNLKNSQIRKLEIENIALEDSLLEAREYMANMASKLKSRNLVNAMVAPDLASPNHPSQVGLSSTITSALLK